MWSTPFSLLKRTFMTIFCKPRTLHIAMGRRSHMVDGSSYFAIQTTLVLFKEGGSPTSSQAKHWCYYRWKVSYKYPLYIRPTFETICVEWIREQILSLKWIWKRPFILPLTIISLSYVFNLALNMFLCFTLI